MVLVGERLVILGERVVEKLGEAPPTVFASVRMLSIELVPGLCSGCHVSKSERAEEGEGEEVGLLLCLSL